MDVFLTIIKDMWANLLDFETGWIFLFLGAGSILTAIITGLVALFSTEGE